MTVGIAADSHEARGSVEHVACAPILELRQTAAGVVLQVQLERPRMKRLSLIEVRGEIVLVHAKVAGDTSDDERPAILRHSGPIDRVHDLKRVLDHQSVGDVQERPAGPEGGVGGLQLVAVDRQSLGVPLLEQLCVLTGRVFERAQDHAALGQPRVDFDVDDRRVELHDPPGAGTVGNRARHELGSACVARVLLRGERLQVQLGEARRPEARAAPHRQLAVLERPQSGLAQLGERMSIARPVSGQRVVEARLAVAPRLDGDGLRRHQRRPPGGSGRSPRAPGARRAPRRPRARSARPSGCARTGASRSAGCAGSG